MATLALVATVQGLIRAPDFAASHPVGMVLLPLVKIVLVVTTGIGLLLRFRPSRWLAVCGYVAVIVMSIRLFLAKDDHVRPHPVADLVKVSPEDPAYLWGYGIGQLTGCLILVTFASWIIYRLLFHSNVLLYFGVKKGPASAPALTAPTSPPSP